MNARDEGGPIRRQPLWNWALFTTALLILKMMLL